MMKKGKKKKNTKWILSVVGILLIAATGTLIHLYRVFCKPFSPSETVYIYVDEKRDFEEVVKQLQEKMTLPSEKLFRFLADRMNYTERVKTGRYAIEPGMTMLDAIRQLRSGIQTPLNLTFNNIRTREDLAGRIGAQIMADSVEILEVLSDTVVAKKYGLSPETLVSMFIPNTYEVYWNTSVEGIMERMKKEHSKFWNESRRNKAEEWGLTPEEVSTLASIVEEEATYADEYPIVAGLYLNRLKKGMRLEADPTVKFALGDFALQRILFKHLEVESPYNTYKIDGLPPGPIRIPSIAAIDAVLSPHQHNYLFMCAKEDLSGRHNFAVTHAEHARNAARYRQALNQRGIY